MGTHLIIFLLGFVLGALTCVIAIAIDTIFEILKKIERNDTV